jgi:hypothetical protein
VEWFPEFANGHYLDFFVIVVGLTNTYRLGSVWVPYGPAMLCRTALDGMRRQQLDRRRKTSDCGGINVCFITP